MAHRLHILLTLVLLTLAGCATVPTKLEKEARFYHVVIVWLNEPGNQQHIDRVLQASKDLEKIPQVLEVQAGRMVPSERAVVDSSYDLALIISFKNESDLKTYIEHPIHQEVVKTVLKPLVQEYKVYDFQSP